MSSSNKKHGGDALLRITIDETLALAKVAAGIGPSALAVQLIEKVRDEMKTINLVPEPSKPKPTELDTPKTEEMEYTVNATTAQGRNCSVRCSTNNEHLGYHLPATAARIANALNSFGAMFRFCETVQAHSAWLRSDRRTEHLVDSAIEALKLATHYGDDGKPREDVG